jgi:hypothetical protein
MPALKYDLVRALAGSTNYRLSWAQFLLDYEDVHFTNSRPITRQKISLCGVRRGLMLQTAALSNTTTMDNQYYLANYIEPGRYCVDCLKKIMRKVFNDESKKRTQQKRAERRTPRLSLGRTKANL